MNFYDYKLKIHHPTPFRRNGNPLSFCVSTSGEMFLTETGNIRQGRATVDEELLELHEKIEDMPPQAKRLFSLKNTDLTVAEALQQNAFGGRDGLHCYLNLEDALKNLGVEREQGILFKDEPLNREMFKEACISVYGETMENGLQSLDRLCGPSFNDKRFHACLEIFHAVRELDDVNSAVLKSRKREILRDGGFHHRSKQKSMEFACNELASAQFDSPICLEFRLAEKLSSVCNPTEKDLTKAVRDTIFPSEKTKLSQKERRLAKDFARYIEKTSRNSQDTALILASLADGGKKREQQIAAIQKSRGDVQR